MAAYEYEKHDYDVVVIGAGGAGLRALAGVQAREVVLGTVHAVGLAVVLPHVADHWRDGVEVGAVPAHAVLPHAGLQGGHPTPRMRACLQAPELHALRAPRMHRPPPARSHQRAMRAPACTTAVHTWHTRPLGGR